jgi:hypothetical protein
MFDQNSLEEDGDDEDEQPCSASLEEENAQVEDESAEAGDVTNTF